MKIYSQTNTTITAVTQQTNYLLGEDLLAHLQQILKAAGKEYSSFLILADRKAYQLFGKTIVASIGKLNKPIVVSKILSSEQNKDLETIADIIRPYFQRGFDRRACLLAIGGGVITDLGGFIASVLLRGIDSVYIPTTLLAQVDAAIGGKTGVNFQNQGRLYKNMVGTFKQPSLVISDIGTLKSLPERELASGMGEIVKYWVGWGKPDVSNLVHLRGELDMTPLVFWKYLMEIISVCQQIKLGVIKQDPFETRGLRQKLNLGHTIGHALEGAADGKLSHGQAVAIGLAAAAKISLRKNLCSKVTYLKIISLLQSLDLPTNFHVTMYRNMITKTKLLESIKSTLKLDKKGGSFVLIKDLGDIVSGKRVEPQLINQVLAEVIV